MRTAALFAVCQNEPPARLWKWHRHYSEHFGPDDLYLLNHQSQGDYLQALHELERDTFTHVLPAAHEFSYHDSWLDGLCRDFQAYLLRSYRCVLCVSIDELLLSRGGSLRRWVEAFAARDDARPAIYAQGYEVIHYVEHEPPLDTAAELWLPQRSWWYPSRRATKLAASRIEPHYSPGRLSATNAPFLPSLNSVDEELLLVHLHRIDYDMCLLRHRDAASRRWREGDRKAGLRRHNLVEDPAQLQKWLLAHADNPREYAQAQPIPEELRRQL